MSPSEHDKTHDQLGQWTERAREGVIGLEFSFITASVRIDEERYRVSCEQTRSRNTLDAGRGRIGVHRFLLDGALSQ